MKSHTSVWPINVVLHYLSGGNALDAELHALNQLPDSLFEFDRSGGSLDGSGVTITRRSFRRIDCALKRHSPYPAGLRSEEVVNRVGERPQEGLKPTKPSRLAEKWSPEIEMST
jgi:hypothetical protein